MFNKYTTLFNIIEFISCIRQISVSSFLFKLNHCLGFIERLLTIKHVRQINIKGARFYILLIAKRKIILH